MIWYIPSLIERLKVLHSRKKYAQFLLLIYVLLYFLIVDTLPCWLSCATLPLSRLGSDESFLLYSFLPVKVYKDLTKPEEFKIEIHKLGGVYGLVNISDPKNIKQYIGSSIDIYER